VAELCDPAGLSNRCAACIRENAAIDHVVTHNEGKRAARRQSIKRLMPRYKLAVADDKSFRLSISPPSRLSADHKIRGSAQPRKQLFGPLASAGGSIATLVTLQKGFLRGLRAAFCHPALAPCC